MSHFDLVIIGTGSGNTIVNRQFADWSVAIVESGPFGGTCLNVGCIPTKMYVYPSDVVTAAADADRLGVSLALEKVDWPGMRDRIFGRIDGNAAHAQAARESEVWPNVSVLTGTGRFVDDKRLAVTAPDGSVQEITADRFVIAAGGRPVIPDVPGLDEGSIGRNGIHTSDTVMRIDELPRRIVVVGGGYIAAEFAHVFSALGSTVIQLVRGDRLLRSHDDEVAAAYTEVAAGKYDLRRNTELCGVGPTADGNGVAVSVEGPYGEETIPADVVLLATGRQPNSDLLDVRATGVAVGDDGLVQVDDQQRTSVDGIWALGDICSPWQLKHVANHEAKVVRHNLLHPDEPIASDHRFVPAAVFTDPQIASVGLTEQDAIARGVTYAVGRRDYGDTAAGWAREDHTGFVKVLVDPETGLLLGAHAIGPEAATVIQPLIQAMSFGQTADQVARGQYWIHPALPEVVENALLEAARNSRRSARRA
ncbi:mycothione reductase [Nakamurella flava]|uniref:Mycothione reductase n=1 Tax=Nakamurella flava TaxID=2576308 RepID=A0A4U6QKE7_9ACTN|nr:mycothione reductase [Nakamurella flava]TKV60977.1 mycothione reductase [Nakamurella flava]